MKARLSYIFIGILLASLSLCTSCNVNDDVVTNSCGEGGEPMLVTFSLDVRSHKGTRAGDNYKWGDTYPSVVGEGAESYIDPSSILVFAYKNDGTFVAQLPILLNSTDDNGAMSILCTFPNSTPYRADEYYRFLVLANCISKNYTISYDVNGKPNIDNLMFSEPFNGAIPMWGVKSYRIPTVEPESNEFNIGSISMLRATAKVGVKLSDELKAEGYKIGGLKLNYANSIGYCAPNGWGSVSSTELLLHDAAFRPNKTAGLKTDINAVAVNVNDKDSYYIYVPETNNNDETFTSATGQPNDLSIAITLQKVGENGTVLEELEFPYENGIRFCNYDDEGLPTNEYFNIVRNHYYDYTITAVNVGLKMNLEVAEWVAEPVWNLEFTAPVHTKLLTEPKDDAPAPTSIPTLCYDNTNDTGEARAFVGYFKIESPKGAYWKPTLANASVADYDVRVYTTDGVNPEYDVLVTDDQIEVNGNSFYKIVVVAKNPNNIGNVIKLGLTYTATWNYETTPLLIINKGDNNGLYYPWDNSGYAADDNSDIHWISILQE